MDISIGMCNDKTRLSEKSIHLILMWLIFDDHKWLYSWCPVTIRKGQVEGVKKGDVKNQIKFIENLFELAM
ncbi:hypothetical protein [Desulfobacter hydrogenophilus]|nr:hypothetical protein [Desulfobacter hydrogenophilus]NDY71439.1 hypothetical protein [Desulfobacter hydrogenophilus]QBH12178.1 hypothetical protein EYB58_04090 [Desulfobacter hydrogenophilus]